jgi:dihydroxyacetone kinase
VSTFVLHPGIRSQVEAGKINLSNPQSALEAMSDVCATEMGGSSGALYSLFFSGASRALSESWAAAPIDKPSGTESIKDARPKPHTRKHLLAWSEALKEGIENVKKYGGADAGDRTMVSVF